jgi:hypothetical protein
MAAETGTFVAGLVAKLWPAAVGAAIAVAVGPKTITRQEAFLRIFVALGCSYLFSDALRDYLVMSGPAWFDPERHHTALDGLIGCFGWAAMGGLSLIAQRFRTRPLETVREVRDTLKD